YIERGRELQAKQKAAGMKVGLPSCPSDEDFATMAKEAKTVEEQLKAEAAAKKAQETADQNKQIAVETIKKETGEQGINLNNQQAEQVREKREREVKVIENEFCELRKKLRRLVAKLQGFDLTWERIQVLAENQMSPDQQVAQAAETDFNHRLFADTCA